MPELVISVPQDRESIFEDIMPENIPELVTDKDFQRSITYTKQNKQTSKHPHLRSTPPNCKPLETKDLQGSFAYCPIIG